MILASSPAGGFVRPLRALPPRRTAPAARIVSSVRKFGAERPPLLLTRAEKDDESPSSSPTPSSSSALSNISTPSSSSTSDAADVDVDDPFFTDDEETAWLTQFLPFSRLSLDAATWLAANAERETLSPGQKVLVPGGPPALVAVRSGRVGVAREVECRASAPLTTSSSTSTSSSSSLSSSSSTSSRYTAAGPGASFGASDLLANRASRSDIVTLGDGGEDSSSIAATTTILRITPAILNKLAELFPGAERALLFGAVDAGEEAAALAAADAAALRQELQDAAKRAAALQPFLVTSPKRGIVGVSRYASRLRKEIIAASRDPARGPVFVFGEPGLNKDNVAALVHFGSADHSSPMVCVDCGRLSGDGADLFGRGARPGLLSALRDGTLLLNNVHLAPPSLADALVQLLASGTYTRAFSPRRAAGAGELAPAPILRSPARIMITAERRQPRFEALMTVIRVPPLRVRPADIAPLADFFLRDLARRTGAASPPTLSAAALRQLEAYAFPDNIAELQSAVERAAVHSGDRDFGGGKGGSMGGGAGKESWAKANQVVPASGLVKSRTTRGVGSASMNGGGGAAIAAAAQAAARASTSVAVASGGSSSSNSTNTGGRKPVKPSSSMPLLASVDGATISADALWFAAADSDRGRINLLQTLPWLKSFVRSDFWRDTLPFKIVAPIYVLYVAYLFLGPQDRAHNFGLNLFWCWWWPGSFIVYPFLGRIWCGSICPFMIFGEIAQKGRQMIDKTPLRKWPRDSIEKWGPWFLYALFFGILVWERVWELSDHASLSAWLLLLITAGAVICSAVLGFEHRLWCRYLCPIGGQNALFSKLALTELRARKGVCSGNCTTYHCFKGGPAEPPEGMETEGCPLGSHPANLLDNANCVNCFTCEAACPHRSVEFRLRPPAADIWNFGHQESVAELCLMFMLLGAVAVHHLPVVAAQLGISPGFIASQLTPHEGLPASFFSWHALATAVLLAAPAGFVWGVDWLWRAAFEANAGVSVVASSGGGGAKDEFAALLASASSSSSSSSSPAPTTATIPPFLSRLPPRLTRVAYAYLPLTWAATLAHYEEWGLREAGTVARVFARSLEDASLLPRSLAQLVPAPAADPAVVDFLQGSTLLLGAVGAAVFTRRLGARPWAQLAPQLVGIALVTAELWYLIVC